MPTTTTQGWPRDRIIESLAWFSFHVPSCVLDDLLSLNHDDKPETEAAQPSQTKENTLSDISIVREGLEPDANGDVAVPQAGNQQKSSLEISAILNEELEREENGGMESEESEEDEDNIAPLAPMPSRFPKHQRTGSSSMRNINEISNASPLTQSMTPEFIKPKRGTVTIPEMVNDVEVDPFLRSVMQRSKGGNGVSVPKGGVSVKVERFVLPEPRRRQSALLFIDISGFTKLSTSMNIESFSKAINSYFDKIVNEIKGNGGDILKFAGDALFAEWQMRPPPSDSTSPQTSQDLILQKLHMITRSLQPDTGKELAKCVTDAALCGAAIVEKYSDWLVPGTDVKLNVHCGLSAGELVGLHVENEARTKREYVFLGDPVEQVAEGEAIAGHGELVASKEAIKLLTKYCLLPRSILSSDSPCIIATKKVRHIRPRLTYAEADSYRFTSMGSLNSDRESLIADYKDVQTNIIERLQRQISLYSHSVVCRDEAAKKDYRRSDQMEHTFEAELREVYVMFINLKIDSKITGDEQHDKQIFKQLGDIFRVACAVIEKEKGHIRQFINDDKGVVLIATFGLRWSTSPNMVATRALPATMLIHKNLKEQLNVDNRIGATYGKVRCGVVGGVRRHEYAALGPSVNLAARLMCSVRNEGILVNETVKNVSEMKYVFKSLGKVKAKGYTDLVRIYQPMKQVETLDDINYKGNFMSDDLITQLAIERIDGLDPMVRKVLQTCAVLGSQFHLEDVFRVNLDVERERVVEALEKAMTDQFLKEIIPSKDGAFLSDLRKNYNRSFQFIHEQWRNMVMDTMMEEKMQEIDQILKHFRELQNI